MKKSCFTDSQIIAVLKQGEAEAPVSELCMASCLANFYQWHRARVVDIQPPSAPTWRSAA